MDSMFMFAFNCLRYRRFAFLVVSIVDGVVAILVHSLADSRTFNSKHEERSEVCAVDSCQRRLGCVSSGFHAIPLDLITVGDESLE